VDQDLETIVTNFSRIYLGGIPPVITDDSAFLSFVCVVTATDALSGYRYGDKDAQGRRIEKRARFIDFVKAYFPGRTKAGTFQTTFGHSGKSWSMRSRPDHFFSLITTARFISSRRRWKSFRLWTVLATHRRHRISVFDLSRKES
jgi:hypothetical protein